MTYIVAPTGLMEHLGELEDPRIHCSPHGFLELLRQIDKIRTVCLICSGLT